MNQKTTLVISAVIILVGIVLILHQRAAIADNNDTIAAQNIELQDLQTNLDTLQQAVNNKDNKLSETQSQLASLNQDLEVLEEELEDENARLDPIREKLQDVAVDVATQKKLDGIDPQLLQKYSNVYFLNENYQPSGLDQIPTEYTLKSEQFHAQALPFLLALLQDARDDNIAINVASAYRSFDRQAQLKEQYQTIYGTGANQFSADQGYSEHQLGTTVDLTSPENNNQLEGFDMTQAYRWLRNNAHRFGFVLSYPDGNQYYQFEPWHWRFVGTALAQDLDDDNEYLYDREERDLQSYRLELFD